MFKLEHVVLKTFKTMGSAIWDGEDRKGQKKDHICIIDLINK